MSRSYIEEGTNSRGVFILSLDCEGLWGMADNPSLISSGRICQQALDDAYYFIISVLRDNGLTATCAFVSAFAVEPDVLYENLELIERLAESNPSWFASPLTAIRTRRLEGWSASKIYHNLSSAGHEMAWHGTTHLPLSEGTPEQAVTLEVELGLRLLETLGARPRTIVFPRNRIGHLHQLRKAGFQTYRDSPREGWSGKLINFACEANVYSSCDMCPHELRNGWRVCRSGAFLNWPSGLRGIIPIDITVRRWKAMLRDAADRGGTVHMWFHPHNLITAPRMRTSFAEIMRYAGQLTRGGDIKNMTIAQAVAHLNLPSGWSAPIG
jgi:hypothetical protein